MTFHQTYVLDTCVCLDLYCGQMIASAMRLPLNYLIPDLVWVEISRPEEASQFAVIPIRSLSGSQVSRVYALRQDKRCRRLTIGDVAAFVMAEDLGAVLLTNDRDLRTLADEEGVVCHGTLWLLDMLVSSRVIDPGQAAESLERIVKEGSWLPKKECDSRLAQWRKDNCG